MPRRDSLRGARCRRCPRGRPLAELPWSRHAERHLLGRCRSGRTGQARRAGCLLRENADVCVYQSASVPVRIEGVGEPCSVRCDRARESAHGIERLSHDPESVSHRDDSTHIVIVKCGPCAALIGDGRLAIWASYEYVVYCDSASTRTV